MNVSKMLLLGGGAAGLIYYLSREKNTVDQITSGVAAIKYNKLNSSLFQTELLVTLRVTNPTTNPVNFTGFSGVLSVEGKTLASASTNNRFDAISLKPGNTDITLPVQFKHLSIGVTLFNLIKGFINKTITNLPITVIGSMQVAGLQLPVNQVYNLSTSALSGIGKARVNLEFSSNAEAEKYFNRAPCTTPKFSLNGVGQCIKGCTVGERSRTTVGNTHSLYSI